MNARPWGRGAARLALTGLLWAAPVLAGNAGPTPPETKGLLLWVRADAELTLDEAQRVTSWPSLEGPASQAFIQENPERRPLLVRAAASGRPALRFDGVDDEMQLTAPLDPAGRSVFAVVKWNAVRGYSFAIGLDRGTDGYLRMSNERQLLTGGFYPMLYQNALPFPKVGYTPGDGRQIFHNGLHSLLRWNVFAVTDNPARGESIRWLGRNEMNNTPENRFAGEIAEILVYDRPLPPAERRQVEQYLGSQYLGWPELVTVSVAAAAEAGAPRPEPATKVFTAPLAADADGVVFHGVSAQPLAAGRYCFSVDASDDTPDAVTNLNVELRVGTITMPLPRPRAASASAFHPVNANFEIPHGSAPEPALVRISWSAGPLVAVTNAPVVAAVPPLAVRGVQIETLCPVKIIYARPDKIRYQLGEAARAEVRLVNTADQPQTVDVRGWEVTDFNVRRAIGTQTVTVVPASTNVLVFPFSPARDEYGRDLLVELVQAGRVLETATDPFSVADNVWKVALGANPGGPAGSSADYKEETIIAQIASYRDQYANCWEKYFWAPDDWGDLTPAPGATWFSCQARRHENTERIRLQVDTSHRYGIAVMTYGKCMAGGSNGWEMARARPQWFTTDRVGRTMGRPADVWDLDHWQQADKHKYIDYQYAWTYRWVDLRRLDALDHGIEELIASTKQFGWDGVRYDSGGFRAHWVDGNYNGFDPVNTRNMKRTKERLWQAFPGYRFGFNTDNVTARDGRAYPLTVGEMSHEMREMLAGGGLWMGEAIKDFSNGSVQYTNWSQYARDERRCIQAIKEAGGHFCYLFHHSTPVRDTYQFVIGLMIGAHPYGGEHVGAPGSENWGRFLTRWSGLLWDHRLTPLANATNGITVEASRPVWWRDFANQRVLSPTRRQVIVHMVNPPIDDAIAKSGAEFPAAVSTASVSFRAEPKEKITAAWLVSPGAPDRCEALKFDSRRGVVKVTVPAFDIWAMVVLDGEGNYRPLADQPRFTEPLSAAESAELARTTTAASTNAPPQFGMRPPAPTPNVAMADDLLNPAPQHDPSVSPVDYKPAAGVAAPDGLAVGGAPGLDVLVMNGFYYAFHRVPESVRAVRPDARIIECTTRDLPKDYPDLFRHDLVVLADMGADAWDAAGHKRLADFVEAGGRLAVLGGPFTLGQGYFKNSLLESVLPVEVRVARDVYQLPLPLALGDKKGRSFADQPLLYYHHAVKARPDAAPLLWAGELPIAWERKVGKGSSVVFAGTPLGEPGKPEETPFWKSRAWLEGFGRALVGPIGRE